ncbi:ATP synthase mitochondrial F1 complex assembly factor 2 [Tilletia horrida]|nr:ATP synthase mitochondrial F1 complex assembly factor 2 [Tilletia horrida]
MLQLSAASSSVARLGLRRGASRFSTATSASASASSSPRRSATAAAATAASSSSLWRGPVAAASRTSAASASPRAFSHTARCALQQQQQPENASDAAERTLKRFWKTVSVQTHPASSTSTSSSNSNPNLKLPAHYTINLDKRSLRTPAGNVLRIPLERGLLAGLIAQEWAEQRTVLKPHALPLTSLVARSIDGLASPSTRQGVTDSLLAYLDTDTILFHEPEPPQLVRLQSERWTPLIDWVSARWGVQVEVYESLFGTAQSAATREALSRHIRSLDPLALAAFERAVLSSKSFLIGLGLLEGKLSVEQAARAAEVEVASQIERWGEVEDSHDVDYQDVRRMLGSVAVVLMPPSSRGTP